jgi:NADPH-dependent curcumin reductase
VGQLAKAEGCRAVGLAGDDDKVALCCDRFGYDDAANYKKGELRELIAKLAPTGIDIYYDNVGGETLDTAIRTMNIGGRIVQCGTASIALWDPAPQGLRNEREVLLRRLSWSGFVIFDHQAYYQDALKALITLIEARSLYYEEDILDSLTAAPEALSRLYMGENKGKMLIFAG